MKQKIAFIGLGSNLDNPLAQLKSAVKAMEKIDGFDVKKLSNFYSSKPIGPQDQPDYVNAVARIETSLEPLELLDELQAIELQHGRVRGGVRWGARTLDLDILIYADDVINQARLKLPHPEIQNRAFVLYPLSEIEPDIVIPEIGAIETLLLAVDEADISRID